MQDRDSMQALAEHLVDGLFPATLLARRDEVHVEVRATADVQAFSFAWRRPGWDLALCEARGNDWDRPEGRIVLTTGLVELVTPRQLRAVLSHELAHIEAGDHLAQWRWGQESEDAERRADLRAVTISGDGPALAMALLRIFHGGERETDPRRNRHARAGERVTAIAALLAAPSPAPRVRSELDLAV